MSDYDREEKQKTVLRGLTKMGLQIRPGSRHMTATCPRTQRKTTIPRHTVITKRTVRSICEFLISCGYTDPEIKKAFKW